MRLHKLYLLLALVLFGVEVLIATRLGHMPFVRGSLGDFLVVPLIYFSVQALCAVRPRRLAIGTILFAFLVEGLQYLHLADWLGLRQGSIAYVVMGNSFSWEDLLMYFLGGVAVWWVDTRWLQNNH